jgi:single-strand DNA-binding protein
MVNKFIGIGHLCQDPKLFDIKDAKKASFSIGINNTKDDVLFLNIECWNRVAENCEKYLEKGSCVYIEGKIKNSNWTDSSGVKKSSFYINADVVRFLPNGKKATAKIEKTTEVVEKHQFKPNIQNIISDSEIPF